MATSTPADATIPRYLRYKAGVIPRRLRYQAEARRVMTRFLHYKADVKDAKEYWDEELERANMILHGRVCRMHRDKLCTGCARFDLLRTHFYTREARRQGNQDLRPEDRKMKKDFNGSWHDMMTHARFLDGIEDNVQWSSFEIVPGVEEEVKWLAEHPRFKWNLNGSQPVDCTLCKTLFGVGKKLDQFSEQSSPLEYQGALELTIELWTGRFFEEGGSHQCQIGWEKESDIPDFILNSGTNLPGWTNAMIAMIQKTTEKHLKRVCCEIRPIIDDSKSVPNDMPHCCRSERNLHGTIDFNVVAGWLKRCDGQHNHSSNLLPSPKEISGLRLIDIENQCIVERSLQVRYAALSYTWGSRKQYCLTKQNIQLLKKKGALIGLDEELGTTFVDSIKVCMRLSIPYLWIDALCIVQDDEENKHSQIQNMDLIYANAYVTFVDVSEPYVHAVGEKSRQRGTSGLSRVSTPAPSSRVTTTMDGVSYLYSTESIESSLSTLFSSSLWFSRGWTLQELALSRRMLIFRAQEAVFYCPDGLLVESVCKGGDQYESLLFGHPYGIGLCGLSHQRKMKPVNTRDLRFTNNTSPMSDVLLRYNYGFLPLLDSYLKRVLTYESDILNAFSGIINAEARTLGPFHWGLPKKLFARALVSGIDDRGRSFTRRSDFPSWSWLGWRFGVHAESGPSWTCHGLGWKFGADKESPHVFGATIYSPYFLPLVHIYECSASGHLSLLLGQRDDSNNLEGYDAGTIANYNNKLTLDQPLPLHPNITETPSLPASLLITSQLLVFWGHVARIELGCKAPIASEGETRAEGHNSHQENHTDTEYKFRRGLFEVVLIGIESDNLPVERQEGGLSMNLENQSMCHGIIIERCQGFVRRLGVKWCIPLCEWLEADPQLELIFLI